VEVVRRYCRALVGAVRRFLEEAGFRISLAIDVLAGNLLLERDRRLFWHRAIETPTLIDVRDWSSNSLIFTAIIWPPLAPHDAAPAHLERVNEVKDAIARGAADRAWSTLFEIDHALAWDPDREVWTTDGHAVDSARLREYSRGGG
jgi:hypothetical protein